jgi:hypothetical protein
MLANRFERQWRSAERVFVGREFGDAFEAVTALNIVRVQARFIGVERSDIRWDEGNLSTGYFSTTSLWLWWRLRGRV